MPIARFVSPIATFSGSLRNSDGTTLQNSYCKHKGNVVRSPRPRRPDWFLRQDKENKAKLRQLSRVWHGIASDKEMMDSWKNMARDVNRGYYGYYGPGYLDSWQCYIIDNFTNSFLGGAIITVATLLFPQVVGHIMDPVPYWASPFKVTCRASNYTSTDGWFRHRVSHWLDRPTVRRHAHDCYYLQEDTTLSFVHASDNPTWTYTIPETEHPVGSWAAHEFDYIASNSFPVRMPQFFQLLQVQ